MAKMGTLEQLKEENIRLRADNEVLSAERNSLALELKYTRQELNLLKRKIFGSKSEKVSDSQLMLALEILGELKEEEKEESPLEEKPAKKHRKRPVRTVIPDHVEVEETVIQPREVIGHEDEYEIIRKERSERLDLIPAKLIKRVTIRPIYVKKELDSTPICAPMPPHVIDKGIADVGLLVYIIISKYVDHLPLYRMEQIFKRRYDVSISRKTMCDWVRVVAEDWLLIIYNSIRQGLKKKSYLQADETVIKYQDPELEGKTGTGYLWVYSDPDGDLVYDWQTGRSKSCFTDFIEGYEGILQSDGYGVYESVGTEMNLRLVGCWAHARRKFYEAYQSGEKDAIWYLLSIKELYKIETQIKEGEDAEFLRQTRSRKILEDFKRRLECQSLEAHKKNRLTIAVSYASNQWDKLIEYIEHPHVKIDNNMVEQGIRPTKLGLKNWLFVGSPKAGKRTAIIYTIVECCKRHGVNPQQYLYDVLRKLPTMKQNQIESLLPQNWKNTQHTKNTSQDGVQ
tara:strand:+ start:456 stop:1988 length:1533 start_codon:yes stop_codon:yes gene_type:complete